MSNTTTVSWRIEDGVKPVTDVERQRKDGAKITMYNVLC